MQVKIACLQTSPKPDFDSAVAEALRLARQADSDTQMLFLPEYCSGIKVDGRKFLAPAAQPHENPMLLALQDHAKQNNVWVMAGSVAIPGRKGKIRNAGFVINSEGELVTRYDKIHLFDIQLSGDEVYRESDSVEAGSELTLVDSPLSLIHI